MSKLAEFISRPCSRTWASGLLPLLLLLIALLSDLHDIRGPVAHAATAALRESAVSEAWLGSTDEDANLKALLAPARCDRAPPPMAFLHLPKTGGTSVIRYMRFNLHVWCSEIHVDYRLSFVSAVKSGAANWLRAQQINAIPQRNCSFSHLLAGPRGDARPAYAALVLGEGFRIQVGSMVACPG